MRLARLLPAALLALALLGTPAGADFNTPEIFTYSNISASTAPFTLRGGQYGITVHATWSSGSVTLQRLAVDNSTYVTVLTAFSADGYASVNLPSGTYKFTVATASAIYLDITSIVTTM